MLECDMAGVVYLPKGNNDVTQEEVLGTLNGKPREHLGIIHASPIYH